MNDFETPLAIRFLADTAVSGINTLAYWQGAFYRWEPDLNYYRVVDLYDLKRLLHDYLGAGFKPNHKEINGAVNDFKIQALLTSTVTAPSWVAVPEVHGDVLVHRAGLFAVQRWLDDRDDFLLPATPAYFSTSGLDYVIGADAECPTWLRCVAQWTDGEPDLVPLLQQWAGYVLTADTSQEKALLICGPGGSGKSKFAETIVRLVGERASSYQTFDKLGDSFGLEPLLNKSLLWLDETDDSNKIDLTTLKRITGRGRCTVNRKNKSQVEWMPTVRVMGTTNILPYFPDQDGAWQRRLLFARFNNKVADAERDPRLNDKLAAELPGIFWWAMDGLRQLRGQGWFTESAASKAMLVAHLGDSDPVSMFIDDNLVESSESTIASAELVGRYRIWAMQHGRQVASDRALVQAVFRKFPRAERVAKVPRGGGLGRSRGVRGVKFGDPDCSQKPLPVPLVKESIPPALHAVSVTVPAVINDPGQTVDELYEELMGETVEQPA
jgi:P4 family phage/plasmid primase-like protien